MFLRGIPHLVVGINTKEGIFNRKGAGSEAFFHCEAVEGDSFAYPEELETYQVAAKVSSSDLTWYRLEQLVWVLDPGALYEKVCGEAWLESAREEEAFQTQLLFARWYEAQINLCAQLAFGDNMRCNNVLGKIMPFELCFSAIWNERLPMCMGGRHFELSRCIANGVDK